MLLHDLHLHLKLFGVVPIIVTSASRHIFPFTTGNRRNIISQNPFIGLVKDGLYDFGITICIILQHLTGLVSRAILAYHNLKREIDLLRQQRIQSFRQCILLIIGNNRY